MISGDALLLASATVAVLGGQQWFLHWQNRKQYEDWIKLLSFLLKEYPLHRHDADGKISFPKVKLSSHINGKIRLDEYT